MMRAWRALAIIGWLFFLGALAYISFSGRPRQARAIKLDDDIVLWVKDGRAADRVLKRVLESKRGAHFDATVAHETLDLPEGVDISGEREAMAQLAQRLNVLVVGWKIVVEGKDMVTMDSKEHADKVLEELKTRWAQLKDGEQIIEQRLDPEPDIRETTVPPDELHTDVAAAAEMLQSSEPESLSYVVQPGDNPSLVASKFGVRLSDLVAQNPTLKQVIDGERYLRPGEKLVVRKQRKGVKVITVKQYEEERITELPPLIRRTAALPEGEERLEREGTPERRKVIATVTLVNDKEIGRDEELLEPFQDGERPIKLVGTAPAAR